MAISGAATWTEKASQDNALATATKAAAAGVRHYCSSVTASFSGAATKTLQIKSAAVVIFEVDVVNQQHLSFPRPLEGGINEDLVATLAASGAGGNVGKISMSGLTG